MDVILPIFSQRLKQLRRDRKITQKAMAELLGKTERHYQAIEAGCINVPATQLIFLAGYFQTSVDYLLGLTDIDPSDEARKQRQRLTEEEQNEMHRYEEYLLWKRKK